MGITFQLLGKGKDAVAFQRGEKEISICVFKCLYFLELPDFGEMSKKKTERIEVTILIVQCGSYSCLLPLQNQSLQPHSEFSFTKHVSSEKLLGKDIEKSELGLRNTFHPFSPLRMLL